MSVVRYFFHFIFSFLLIVLIFVFFKINAYTIDNYIGSEVVNVNLVINNKGSKKYNLKASRMYFDKKMEIAIIYDPKIVISIKNNKKFYISAKTGFIDFDSNYISFFGSIFIQNDEKDYIIKTLKLGYDPNNFFLVGGTCNIFFKNGLNIRAKNFFVNLTNQYFIFDENVQTLVKKIVIF